MLKTGPLFRLVVGITLLGLMPACGRSSSSTLKQDPNTVIVKDFEFAPATLAVKPGTTVTWDFQGPTPHSTTADSNSPEKWDSGELAAGKTYSRVFNAAGSFPYHCDPHPYMKGTIVVK